LIAQKIIEEMTRYDVGIIPFNIAGGNRRFLNTSLANKLHEYLAAGLPVVASDLVSYNDFFARTRWASPLTTPTISSMGWTASVTSASMQDLRQYCKTYEGEIHGWRAFTWRFWAKCRPNHGRRPGRRSLATGGDRGGRLQADLQHVGLAPHFQSHS
jgi:hypothetical protein